MKLTDKKPVPAGWPEELGLLLDEIAREPVPENLLHLAIQLQEKLRKQRALEMVETTV